MLQQLDQGARFHGMDLSGMEDDSEKTPAMLVETLISYTSLRLTP